MLRTLLLLSAFSILFISTSMAKAVSADTINRMNKRGERVGYWILSPGNEAVTDMQSLKGREGTYINGRRNGVWITYFEDGVTPRLIGEYADNRPAGAYFRFDKTGELTQASSVPKRISVRQSVQVTNSIFSCKMFFDNRDIVAGQVFFTNQVFKKDLAVEFWVESSMKTMTSESKLVDFSWLNTNYNQILTRYMEIRTPGKLKVKELPVAEVKAVATQELKEVQEAKSRNYYFPPVVKQPRVAKGMVFVPSGLNKLYTEENEIWIDGHFLNGQLNTGKVFIYDRDGVLLKVRVYKDGVYDSDGVL